MKKKVLILGSYGMLGHVVFKYLHQTGNYIIADSSFPKKLREESLILDVSKKEEVRDLVLNFRPDIIINCIGILIRGSKSNPANAIYLNSYFPHHLSALLRETGGRLIHISTDCVFSGSQGSYSEKEKKDAQDIYGLSKALGEVINENDLTFRTSILGPELSETGEGLLHWFLRQKGEINGFTNAFWSGVTTLELARAIDAGIAQNLTGLYHLTNNEKISKFSLLTLINEIFKLKDIKINASGDKVIDKSLINTRKDFNFSVRSYEEMVLDLYHYMQENRSLYNQYQY